jgi:hypothetical protein
VQRAGVPYGAVVALLQAEGDRAGNAFADDRDALSGGRRERDQLAGGLDGAGLSVP